MKRLLGIRETEIERFGHELAGGRRPALPGAVRASIGLGTTADDVDLLIAALVELARSGPGECYRYVPELDEYEPLDRLSSAA